MDKRYVIVIIAGIIVALSAGFTLADDDSEGTDLRGFSFTYVDANRDLQMLLLDSDIHMSSPLKLNGLSIEKYCTFFADEIVQSTIDYCTSTEILDSDGRFLGNIQMVGSTQRPEYVIVVVQTDDMVSQSDDLKKITKGVIDTLVCPCWEEESPGGFATISDWIDAAQIHHSKGIQDTSRSSLTNLADRDLLLEITKNAEGHLWKMVVFS